MELGSKNLSVAVKLKKNSIFFEKGQNGNCRHSIG